MPKPERPTKRILVWSVAFIFFGLPALIGYGAIPLTNFTAEALCVTGLALMVCVLGFQPELAPKLPLETRVALAAFTLLGFVTSLQFFALQQRQLEAYLVILGYLACSGIAIHAGFQAAASAKSDQWLNAGGASLVAAAVIAALASIAQYFEIDARAFMVSPATDIGRTYGFFRQPNQQGTFLNLGLAALFFFRRTGKLKVGAWLAISFLLVFAIATTGSRTALVQITFLSLCSLALSPFDRKAWLSAAIPLVLVLGAWLALYAASSSGKTEFYGSQKLQQTLSEGVGMRSAVWHEAVMMLGERPLTGYGVLRYPSVFFMNGSGMQVGMNMSHSHNLFLQLAIDFGLPIASLFCALIAWVIWRARSNWLATGGGLAVMVLGCLLIHSLVEFPLWYTYFLLPGCWFLGWLSYKNVKHEDDGGQVVISATRFAYLARRVANSLVGLLTVLTVLTMNRDYFYLTPAFAPGLASTQVQRVEDTRKAFWFSRFSKFALLQIEPYTVAGAADRMRRAAELGCVMPEVWFQTQTLAVMAQTGYADDAKWILYIISRMTKTNMDYYREGLIGSGLPGAIQLAAYLDDLKPVPRSVRSFEQTCSAK